MIFSRTNAYTPGTNGTAFAGDRPRSMLYRTAAIAMDKQERNMTVLSPSSLGGSRCALRNALYIIPACLKGRKTVCCFVLALVAIEKGRVQSTVTELNSS